MRFGYNNTLIISNYDLLLKIIAISPNLILRFGRKPTSKTLCQLLDSNKNKSYLIDPWLQYNDDSTHYIQSEIDDFCSNQCNNINWKASNSWTKQFIELEKQIHDFIQNEKTFIEANIARTCLETLKSNDQFIIGNSMPIRDVDMFCQSTITSINTYSNRGASGIDGIVSTALGISMHSNNNALLLIGDLSFYHDMNGLLATKNNINLTIVVINNHGGGIFSYLPIAKQNIKSFKEFWTTNIDLDIKTVANLYQCKYDKCNNLNELYQSIINSFHTTGTNIIEVCVDIDKNVTYYESMLLKLKRDLTN